MTIRGLHLWLLLVVASAVTSTAFAQPPGDVEPPPPEPEPMGGDDAGGDEVTSPEGPDEAGASIEIDTRQQELERAQRELEQSQDPDQEMMVIDPVSVEVSPEDSRSHRNQVGIRVGAGVPFIVAIRYASGPRCNTKLDTDGEPEQFCARVGKAVLDLDLGFGVTHNLELSFAFRLGLDDDIAAEARPVGLSLGVRSFPAPHALVKIYLGGRLYMDITNSDVLDYNTVDIGARGEFGLEVDPVRFLGIYAQLGMNVLFLRGFYFVPDITGGIQVRFP